MNLLLLKKIMELNSMISETRNFPNENRHSHNGLNRINKSHTKSVMINLIKSQVLVPHVGFWHVLFALESPGGPR